MSKASQVGSVMHHVHAFGHGGTERVAAGLFLRAKQRGEPVRIAAPLGGSAERGLREEVGANLEGVAIRNPNEPNRLGALAFARWARRQRADVIHAHLPSPDRLGTALLARADIPCAFTFHLLVGRPVKNDIVFGRQVLRKQLLGTLDRRAPLELIALSRADAALLEDAYGNVPITIVHNAPPPPTPGPPIDLPFGNGTRILCVGRLHRQKGFDLLLEALAPLRERSFSMCIVGEGEERPALEALIRKHSLGERVRLVGALPATRTFHQADLLISPSRYEGFPLTLLEAIEAGLPALVSDIPIHREAVGHLPSVVLPGDTREWSATIARFIEDRGAREELGRGLHALQERFSREAQDRAYAEVYRRLLART